VDRPEWVERDGLWKRRVRRSVIVVVFSGEDDDTSLAARARRRGFDTLAVDTKIGGAGHDVRRPDVREEVERWAACSAVALVFVATPCESFSVAHRPQLRSSRHVRGLPSAPPQWRAYLRKHNELADWSGEVAGVAHRAGVPWAIENPADRGRRGSPAWWERMRDHGCLERFLGENGVLRATGALTAVFAQCQFGAPVQKYTVLIYSALLEPWYGRMRRHVCTCPQHTSVAYGRDAHGVGRAELAARYPVAMSEEVVDGVAAWCRAGHASAAAVVEVMVAAQPLSGLIGQGAALGALANERCERAAELPAPFASLRNMRAEAPEALMASPIPGDLAAGMPPSSKPRGAAKRVRGPRLPPPSVGGEAACDAATARPAGPIAIHQLYGEGLYDAEIVPWLERAHEVAVAAEAWAAACEAARAAGAVEPTAPAGLALPTVVIPASRQPAWARGKVWDSSDPSDCVEVRRSTRHTVFPGRRQLDRAALRAMAAEIGWAEVDADILSQAGEGGIEMRSECDASTVLAGHHRGYFDNLRAAQRVISANIEEEWVTRPVPHLPRVPCKLQPRNVIMQERSRVDAAGEVEYYDKPRVTTNTSNGAEESVNGGVSPADRAIVLPTVQAVARGAAVVRTASDDGPPIPGWQDPSSGGDGGGPAHVLVVRVGGYAVDLESAYSFLQMQLLDVHLQCFLWWEWRTLPDGRRVLVSGVCMSYRLEFGGAFAPNRFFRVSSIVAAHAQRAHAAFDAAQPPPPRAQAWSRYRTALQAQGRLPGGEAQRHPRHLQAYMDDYNGSALDDPVRLPEAVAALGLDAPPSRVHAHTGMVILSARSVGFAESVSKTQIGRVLGSLGFEVDLDRARIRCPGRKRVVLLAEMEGHRARAEVDLLVKCVPARSVVGRLCNLTQIFPELKPFMHGGYRVSEGRWLEGRRERRASSLRLAKGSPAQGGWLELLHRAADAVQLNAGVPLAAEACFVPRHTPGVVTVVTDASGKDGVGGFAFMAGRHREVWLVAEWWGAALTAALAAAASTGEARLAALDAGAPMLAMPAAELFGSGAVVAAVAEALALPEVLAVYAVGDCQPAVDALTAAAGGTAQMRCLVEAARRWSPQWMGVHVPREHNTDADRLSHPQNAEVVARAAADAGLLVREARVPASMWAAALAAAALGVGRR
jgi:hypothetical protein